MQTDPALHDAIVKTNDEGLFGKDVALDPAKYDKFDDVRKKRSSIRSFCGPSKACWAWLPSCRRIMCVCYLILLGYFRSKGGYEAQVISGHRPMDERFTGGVPGAMEA